jgi:glycine/D-amino acid oxidase-like deaminating enzyme
VSLGVELITADVAVIETDGNRATGVRLADGTRIAAGTVIVTAGTATPSLVAPLGVALPVEARKRHVFTFACRTPLPGLPLLIDPSGVYVRPEGDVYICGASPPADNDPPATDFEVDHAFFEETIWPVLAARIPAFEAIRPGRAWAGHYDFNTLDQNAIVGPLPGSSTTCSSPPAFPATACSRRRRSVAASPSSSRTAATGPRPAHHGARPVAARLRPHRRNLPAHRSRGRVIRAHPRAAGHAPLPLGVGG